VLEAIRDQTVEHTVQWSQELTGSPDVVARPYDMSLRGTSTVGVKAGRHIIRPGGLVIFAQGVR